MKQSDFLHSVLIDTTLLDVFYGEISEMANSNFNSRRDGPNLALKGEAKVKSILNEFIVTEYLFFVIRSSLEPCFISFLDISSPSFVLPLF